MLLLPFLFEAERIRAIVAFQTFNLALGGGLRIKGALLDRFLACMKPASITSARLVRAFFCAEDAGSAQTVWIDDCRACAGSLWYHVHPAMSPYGVARSG